MTDRRRRLRGPARVRNAPRLVASELVGAELGSIARRGPALAADLVLGLLVGLPLAIGLAFLSLSLQVGGFSTFRDLSAEGELTVAQEQARREAKAELIRLLARKRPSIVPPEVLASLRGGDAAALDERIAGVDLSLSVQLSSGRVESTWDRETDEVVIANDVLLGRLGLVVAGVPLFLAWFTALLRAGRGRTPGKWLFGLRVVRVDGRPLTWWDAFSRAGGYLGSTGMLGLGFLEAAWEPNRQAAHDRLADTLVVRAPRSASRAASVTR